MHQERSYVLALENAAPVGGMYIGEEKNSLSFRDAEGLLLFGGAGTRTGKNREGGNFEQLMQSAKVFYPPARPYTVGRRRTACRMIKSLILACSVKNGRGFM